MLDYQITPSKFRRGMLIVAAADARAEGLAKAFSLNRFSYQEHGYLLNAVASQHFQRAFALGCKAAGNAVEWESVGGERFYRFAPNHCGAALRRIARGE